jgi:hypothetical protein
MTRGEGKLKHQWVRKRLTVMVKCSIVGLLVCLTIGMAIAQNASGLMPDAGYVSSHRFTSIYFGFSYSFPGQLQPNTMELERNLLKRQNPAAVPVSVLASAFESRDGSTPRRGVTIMAHDSTRYGGLSDGKDYLRQLTPSLKRQAWKTLRDAEQHDIDGHLFFRSDYSRQKVYQASVCTVLRGYVLEFVLTGSSEDDVEGLFESLSTLRFRTTGSAIVK